MKIAVIVVASLNSFHFSGGRYDPRREMLLSLFHSLHGLCSGVHFAISQSHLSRRALSKRADNYRGAHEEPWYQKSVAFIHYYQYIS